MLADQEEAGSNGVNAEQMTVEVKGMGFFPDSDENLSNWSSLLDRGMWGEQL